jgi:Zn-dependent peptidase ImmA (M78 family)
LTRRRVGRAKAELVATSLLADLKIKKPPVDVEGVVDSLKIEVFYEPLGSDTSSVLIRNPDGSRYIGVNSFHSRTRQRFSLAHELGHALLHFDDEPSGEREAVVDLPLEVMFRDGVASTGSDQLEIDANAFAAALLMPSVMVKAGFQEAVVETPRSAPIAEVIDRLAERFDVSPEAMRYRLVNLNLLDPA